MKWADPKNMLGGGVGGPENLFLLENSVIGGGGVGGSWQGFYF